MRSTVVVLRDPAGLELPENCADGTLRIRRDGRTRDDVGNCSFNDSTTLKSFRSIPSCPSKVEKRDDFEARLLASGSRHFSHHRLQI